jgi:hypothetical protein
VVTSKLGYAARTTTALRSCLARVDTVILAENWQQWQQDYSVNPEGMAANGSQWQPMAG